MPILEWDPMLAIERRGTDGARLFALAAILTAAGLAAVYSASGVTLQVDARYQDHAFLLRRQAMFACGGFLLLIACSLVRAETWIRYRWALLLGAFALLLLVYVPGIGIRLNQAQRWVRLGPYTMQPSEFARLALIVFFAASIARDPERVRRFGVGFAPLVTVLVAACGLIAMEPDVGTSVLTAAVLLMMLFLAGARVVHLAVCGGAAFVLGAVVVAQKFAHVARRIDEWGTGYQIRQSLIAIGAGGLFGEGPGHGIQKLFYLPEAHSDFIFPVWAEELGFLGSIALVALFAALFACGWRVVRRSPDSFGRLAAAGLTASITLGALLNLLVATAMVPAKGTPLPFVSGGGTSLVASLAAVGLLISIAEGADAAGDRGRGDGRAPDGGGGARAAPTAAGA